MALVSLPSLNRAASRTFVLWLPVIVLMIAIFVVSSGDPGIRLGNGSDKLAHAAVYALLSALAFRALCRGHITQATAATALTAAAIGVVYGLSDELHQAFVPGRAAESLDLIADAIGASVAAGGLWAWSILGRTSRRSLSMTFETLRVERDDGVATVTIDRPQVLNALNSATIDELRRVALDIRHDAAVRAVILTGAGEKSFVSGADINELAVLTPTQGKDHALRGQHVFDLIENLGKPVIAAINGYALGGGCELAMACTVRLASENAKLGQPEMKLGLIPGYAGTQRLARLVGKGRALELILTGAMIDAHEAFRIGLVNRVVAPQQLMDEARSLARTLAANSPIATRFAIEAINKGLDIPFAQACFLEATLFGLVASSEDMREGTKAFLEKRTPQFAGR